MYIKIYILNYIYWENLIYVKIGRWHYFLPLSYIVLPNSLRRWLPLLLREHIIYTYKLDLYGPSGRLHSSLRAGATNHSGPAHIIYIYMYGRMSWLG